VGTEPSGRASRKETQVARPPIQACCWISLRYPGYPAGIRGAGPGWQSAAPLAV